jgi:3-(3-hydroxy-phenyl)propionate hydroxylase
MTRPFAGQGMNSGIRDAHNLAWKLATILAGRAGPGLLDTYEQERKDHVWQMIQLALRMGRVMSPSSWLSGFLTQTGFLALNVWPPARNYVAQMKYKPPPYFHAGFLVPDDKGRKSLIGRLFPQPRVRDAAGQEVLLDEVLGNRFVLLTRTKQVADSFARLRQPVWDKLGAARVALLPPDAPAQAADGIEIVRETNDALDAALAPYPDSALLLRPDHYVAAAIPLADADSASRAIEALLAATWTSTGGVLPLSAQKQKAA